ncbi:transient receptor potential cation channel subfamily M member 1-like [Pecten maximus]|uniref:transient receptor potential cation channel subfamily M member 1-like n=1 Tax=Pecten maximus TaxID=6579 RepID=UPI00145819A2|nr:transient receptor potential cation channel subfamily M member 1-like [Pecten maximus]
MASQNSDSNDNLDYPEVAIDPVYATVTSNVSGFSTDSLDPSWMEDLGFSGGVIQFVYDEASGQKANAGLYVSVPEAADADDVATYMAKVWKKRTPNIILSLITSNRHYKHWKDQDLVHDFQTGIITAANTTEMWILTNGFDGGITKILGDAFKDEKQRRKIPSLTKMSMKFVNKQKQENLPKLTVIGVVPKSLLSYNSKIDSAVGPVNIQNKGQKPLSDKQELNSDHTHYIMMEGVTDLRELENFRIKLEERFLTPVGRPKRYRKITNLSDSVLNVGESVPDDLQIISSTCTPMVGLLVQGGPLEMDHVAELLKRNVPVVVMKGTGLAADLISFAYLELQERPHAEHIESYVKPELIKKLMKYFPAEFLEDEIARNRCRDKILECAQNAHQGEQKFLTILPTDGVSSDLKNLDKYLLLALFKSQALKRGRKFQEQFQCDLKLTLDWNRCDLAVSQIFQKYDWARIKITHELFDRALLKKGREEFVDLFLQRDAIQVHKYLNHRKLLYLFNNLENEEFFLKVCLDGALAKASFSAYPVDKDFVIGDDCDFNRLLYRVTYLQHLVSSYELSMNAVGSYVTDQEVAERRAINTLVFWAAITFNAELTKVLWKRTEDPMVMALIVSMIWNNLSKNWCRDLDTKRKVRESAIDFGKMAVKLLDLAYKDSSVIAINALGKKLPDFNDKTVIEIAHIARNKFFIAHTICQKWLDKRWNGKLQIRELELGPFKVADWLMLYLSVFLVFPMFLWITYDVKSDAKDESNLDDSDDEMPSDEAAMLQPSSLQGEKWQKRHSVKYQMRNMLSYGRQNLKVPVQMQFYYLYSAPITKFWISQLFYILYLTIFSLAVLFPSCGNLHMDFVVFGWTLLIWVELVRGVIAKKKKYQEINLFWAKMEIVVIGLFLLAFCLVRIVPHFVSYIDYMTTKFVMSMGLLYFYYRTLQVFLPISPVLGPMLINIRRMIKKDFLTWMRMFLIIMVSGGVTIHAVLYPNYPFTLQGIKMALTRAFFAMFITQIGDLEGNESCSDLYKNTSLSHCRATSPDIFGKNASSMTTDDVTSFDTCPYSSMGGYLVVMQYFVITKLVMITLLYALFSATTAKVRGESEEIWKFQKYSLIVDFEERLRLPPPFSFISYLCMMSASLYRCFHTCCTHCCRRPRGCCRCTCRKKKMRTEKDSSKLRVLKVRRTEDYNYWRNSIKDLMEMEEQEKADKERPKTQSKSIGVLMSQMEKQKHFNGKLTEQMARLERNITTCNLALEQIKHLLDKQQGQKNLTVAMKRAVVHVSSRQSPYPGTKIQRFPVFDKHVAWEVPYLGYDPVVYTCPVEEFVDAIQSLVDPDFLKISRSAEDKLLSREDIRTYQQPSALYNPMWNVAATLKINNAVVEINRASWITQNSTACRYSIDKTNLPLNPMGRTGIRGRGKLWRWGPNHSVLVVLSRWKEKYKQGGDESSERDYIVIEGKRVLEMIVIQRLDTGEFTLPGGNDYGNMSMYSALCKRFQQFVLDQETTAKENMSEQDMISFFSKYSVPGPSPNTGLTSGVIYKGYIDDPSNTDNAWREAEVWNLHYRGGSILDDIVKEKEKKWKEASSYTKLYGNQDMIVKEAALLHGAYY